MSLAIAHVKFNHAPCLNNGIRHIANVFALTQGLAQLWNTGTQGSVSVKLFLLYVPPDLSGMMQKVNATAGLHFVNRTTKYGTQIYACALLSQLTAVPSTRPGASIL